MQKMSGQSKSASISGSLALDGSGEGLSISGNADNTIAAKGDLKAENDIVGATINLSNLDESDVRNILETLKPYEDNMKVLTKKDLSAGVGLDPFGLDLKNSTEGLLKSDLSLDSSADLPGVSFNGLSGGLNAEHGVDGKITGPTLNADLPKLSLNKPSVDAGAAVTMPSIGLPGSDVDGSLKTPDVSVSAPKVKIPNASLEVDKSGEYQAPRFKMLNFKLPKIEPPNTEMDVSGDLDRPSVSGKVDAPNLSLSTPKSHFSTPNLEINEPKVNLNDPDLKFEAPNADIEAPSGKIKWPHLKWKNAKVKGPDTDLNAEISVPDASVPMAKVDGDLDVDVDFPKADIKGPEVDVDSPSGKINWPHLKWKKPKFHGSKDSLDIDANIDPADVNLSLQNVKGDLDPPDVEVNLPKADIKGPDLDVDSSSGKINWPHLKWKKHKVHGLAVDGDLNAPDVNLASPKIEGDIKGPKAELNLPKADLTAPDIDAPSGKINWPHLKWKKHKVHGPKAEVDADWNAPDLDLSTPKIDGKMNSPDIDLNLPKADVDIKKPEVDIDPPSGKIKWPTLKKPKWALSQPKINGPDVDLDADLSGPDLDLSAPKIEGKINSPDIDLNLPKADVDIKKPELDIDPPSGKIKWPTLKKPKWALSQPKVNGPDVDLDADFSSPDLDLSAPKIEGKINSPDVDLNLPKADVDIKKPEIDIDPPSGKIKWPTFKKSKWALSQPKVNGPDVDLDANLSSPDLDLSAPKIEGEIHTPDLNLKAPKTQLQGQKLDLNAKLPNTELEAPDLILKSPNLDTNASKLALTAPDGQIKTPDLELDPVLGDFKMPHFKVPALDLSSPNAGIEAPKVNLSNPDASISVPALELNGPKVEGPKVDISAPDVDANEKFRFPHFKMPKFSFSGSKPKTGEVNASDDDDEAASNIETDVPVFRFHSLPKSTFDGFDHFSDAFGVSKRDDEEQDYVVRKGIRLPVSNAAATTSKIDIMQILKLSKAKPAGVPQTEDANLRLAAPSLDVSASAEAEGSSVGTLKVEKPRSVEDPADEAQRLSQSLANMLCLGSDDPIAV